MPASRNRAVFAALAFAFAAAASANDERVVTLRFFADNPLAQGESLSSKAQRELEAATGFSLRPLGRAGDGAFRYGVPSAVDARTLRASLNRLRATGALVYAEAEAKAAAPAATVPSEPARALLIVLRDHAKRDAGVALRTGIEDRLGKAVAEPDVLDARTRRVRLPHTLAPIVAAELVAAIAARPDVAHVEIDRRAQPVTVPDDPMFASQWNLNDAIGGINAPAAWTLAIGDANAPIAILDTGTLPHPDLAGRVIGGYDFVADPAFAGDGDGRDADPTDPGDFVTAADAADTTSALHACPVTNSTWHGTSVAGLAGAVANNGTGVTPVNWASPILSVRVLGKCGGALSDIAEGIRWAAGLPVANTTANAHPARVINLSLSGAGACGPILQNAITDAIAAGAAIVAAAGNEGVDVADRWPANCNGVIAVAATSRDGSRAFYSNLGARITIAAPGGGFGGSVPVLRNAGATSADPNGYRYGQQIGTSLAAPQVAGVVSLVQALAPQLTPAEVQAMLETSARPFPATLTDACSTATCGAGIVDARGAAERAGVLDALPAPPLAPPPAPIAPGAPAPIPMPPPASPVPAPLPAPAPPPPPGT